METKDFNIFSELFKRTKDELDNMEKTNILIVGKTGVGKSTLINSIFRENIAETGIGRPVTQHIKKLSKDSVPVNLYDTKGLELKEEVQNQIKEEIIQEIEKCQKLCFEKDDKSQLIHICWYCIDAGNGRCEQTDIEWISDIAKKIPVIVVITKAYSKKQGKIFKSKIENINLDCRAVIPIVAERYEIDEDITVQPYGLDKLVEVTYQLLPDAVKRAFNNAQKVNIEHKVKEATKWMYGYVTGCGVIGASPIPFSDAPLLAGAQISMIAHITTIFGLPVDKALLTSIVSSIAGVSGAAITGKTLVSNLIKFIPGVGTFVGTVISSSVAIAITTALGISYINVLKYILEEEAKGMQISIDDIVEKTKYEFKNQINNSVSSISM